jgi:hypothetical protein
MISSPSLGLGFIIVNPEADAAAIDAPLMRVVLIKFLLVVTMMYLKFKK